MSTPEHSKDIIVLYHGSCTDGFGAAYAAWKKFGDSAEYISRERTGGPLDPSIFRNKEVYFLDYSFTKEEMTSYEEVAKKFTVIDHHASAEEAVRHMKDFIFSDIHSAAYLAWNFFHPNVAIPKLILYISDADTQTHTLPEWEAIEAFIYSDTANHFTFEHFSLLERTLEDKDGFLRAQEIGGILVSAYTRKVQQYTDIATPITFEGHQIYAVNAPNEIKGRLGRELAKKTNSFALIFNYESGFWKCSLRSVEDFDVRVIAEKYGGGGHKNSAAFLLSAEFPLLSLVNS